MNTFFTPHDLYFSFFLAKICMSTYHTAHSEVSVAVRWPLIPEPNAKLWGDAQRRHTRATC